MKIKRLLTMFVILCLSVSLLAVSVSAAELGDVDGNGSVDYFDAMQVMQYFAGIIDENELDVSLADVDSSGTVDFFDGMYILQYFAGLIEEFPGKAELTIDIVEDAIIVGNSYHIPYTYTGSGTLTWTSSHPDAAVIDDQGTVTGVSEGRTYITVTDGNISTRCRIWVDPTPSVYASSIGVVHTDGPFYDGVARYAGDYVYTVFRVDVAATYKDIFVSSSDPDVVSVSSDTTGIDNGCAFRLNFESPGTATITARSYDGAVTQTYDVTVKDGYTCAHGGGMHTPEEWAECATDVACENGMTRDDTLGSWRLVTLSADQLTFARAISAGQGFVHDYWSNGIRYCVFKYVGQDEDGKYQFHKCWG